MTSTLVRRSFLAGLTSLLASTALLRAQTALYVEHDHTFSLVRAVAGTTPLIEDGAGKLKAANGTRFLLRPAPEFTPVFVTLRNVYSETHPVPLSLGVEVHHEFEFRAEFQASHPLDHVFLVIDLNAKAPGKLLYVREIGRLEPRKPERLEFTVPLGEAMGAGDYIAHVFVNGVEAFHSEMAPQKVEESLDAMVHSRIAGLVNAPPRPFMVIAPEYPERLRTSPQKGRATVRFTISPTGRILDPQVANATAPEFGDAALNAIRQWRFLPQVKAGTPVPTTVELPLAFDPPVDMPVER